MDDFKAPRTVWHMQHHNAAGELLWEEERTNIVFSAAVNDILNVYFKGAPSHPGWYVGLVNTGAIFNAPDTMVSHSGWTENTNYVAANRPGANFGSVSGASINTVGSKAVFTMTSVGGQIAGAFLVSDSVKGGQAGVLYAANLFATGVKNMDALDTLTIAVTITGA